MSPLGWGTTKIGRNQGVKYPSSFSIPGDTQVKNILSLCQELGINTLDTAPAYGNSEQRLGKLLSNRHDWVIINKVGEEFINGESIFDFSAKHTRLSVERSLQRLKTDYIDAVLVHSDGNDCDIITNNEVLPALAELKKAGLIRSFGVSTKTVTGGLLALEHSDIAMVTYNLKEKSEGEVIRRAIEGNQGILLKKAFASGHICKEENIDPIQASMDFIFEAPGVSSAIIGSIQEKHIKHNVECAIKALST